MTLDEMQREAHRNSRNHGFHDNEDPIKSVPEKIALIHSELSEALEHYRDGNAGLPLNETWVVEANKKPDGFAIELADVLIRIGDLAGQLNIDLTSAVEMKMDYNRGRPHKHGKVC